MTRTDNFTVLRYQEEIDTLLQAVSWNLRITVHTTDGYPSAQKVFSGDMIIHVRVVSNWVSIKERKKDNVQQGNAHKKYN